MWRDPYSRGWGERVLIGLASLLAVAIGLQLLARLLSPLIPLLFGAVFVTAGLLWFLQHLFKR